MTTHITTEHIPNANPVQLHLARIIEHNRYDGVEDDRIQIGSTMADTNVGTLKSLAKAGFAKYVAEHEKFQLLTSAEPLPDFYVDVEKKAVAQGYDPNYVKADSALIFDGFSNGEAYFVEAWIEYETILVNIT